MGNAITKSEVPQSISNDIDCGYIIFKAPEIPERKKARNASLNLRGRLFNSALQMVAIYILRRKLKIPAIPSNINKALVGSGTFTLISCARKFCKSLSLKPNT